VNVEVLSVGDELLSGAVADTNAGWLARLLTEAGLAVSGMSVVGDHEAAIRAAASAALGRADAVVVTGGLGPTGDDLTEPALLPLAAGPDAVRRLPNPVGTAAGLAVAAAGGGTVYAVPGVPREMTAMVTATVLPELRERAGGDPALLTRTLHTVLLREAEVVRRLAPLEHAMAEDRAPGPAVRLAYLAAPGEVRVRLTAAADTPAAAARRLEPWVDQARDLLGTALCGIDEPLAAAVLREAAARGATVAVAESVTGGLVGAALTEVPGSSAVFAGGVTVYATELKAKLLGVDPDLLAARGAVDAEVARQLAAGVRARLGTTYGVATTGVAGPDPQDGNPPGTVHVAVAGPDRTLVRSPRLAGDRDRIRRLTVVHALDLLRSGLAGGPDAGGDYSG
jgi:nicotinamide-nucleotide amidase